LQLAAGGKMMSNPIRIVTNYAKSTRVTLPIDSKVIPADQKELDAFIASLAVLVEHSDGEIRLQKGTLTYDANGKPIAVSIWVDKFSTFTLVQTSFTGTEKILKNKQMPDKVLHVNLNGEIDTATVTEDNVYVLDAKGNKVEVTLECDGSKLTITPVSYYTVGETYTLYITQNVHYKNRKPIESARKYQFTIGNIALSASEIKEYTKTDSKKIWMVNLSKDIDSQKLKSTNVIVVDQYCNKTAVTVAVVKGSYLQIKPQKAYESGNTYYLIVNGITFTDNTALNAEKCIKFTVK
jgi:uncharacterized lipoprotein NlpE involved in copper resistance